jgi:hypothetical protein
MWRGSIAVAVVTLMLAVPSVRAQRFGDEPPAERNAPAAQFAVASFTLMAVMLIICMPSRKRPAP